MLSVTSSLHEGRDGRRHPVVRIEGDITVSTIPRLSDTLARELATSDAQLVIVDLDAVGVIDDAGLGILLGAAASARATGRTVAMIATVPRLRGRLADTRFDRAVDVVSSALDAERLAR
jgi:anti-anti-sigma factor